MFPFEQTSSGGKLIRKFSADTNPEELVWHRDRNDRYVTVTEGKDWYIQLDNQLPIKLVEGHVYYIPAHNYHRIIKGSTCLVLEIKESVKMKITRKQIRKIIIESMSAQLFSIPTETYAGEWSLFQDDLAKKYPSLTAIKLKETSDLEEGLIVGPKEDLWAFESEYVNPVNHKHYRRQFERRVKPYNASIQDAI